MKNLFFFHFTQSDFTQSRYEIFIMLSNFSSNVYRKCMIFRSRYIDSESISTRIQAEVGARVEEGTVVCTLEECSHAMAYRGSCSTCLMEVPAAEFVPTTHNMPLIRVSKEVRSQIRRNNSAIISRMR